MITRCSLPGLELTFYSGVYGTCIGAMTRFGSDAKSLIGLSGICIGIGEILGELPLLLKLCRETVCSVPLFATLFLSRRGRLRDAE